MFVRFAPGAVRSLVLAILPFVLLAGSGCAPFSSREALVYRKNFASYRLFEEDYPDTDLQSKIGPTQALPPIDAAQLHALLSGLRYRRQLAWSVAEGPIFQDRELEYLSPYLLESLQLLPAGYRLLFTSRYDADRSVSSREYRTTAMLWQDQSGLNLIFGEIHEAIPGGQSLNSAEWTDVSPISFHRAFPDLEILSASSFQFKSVDGRNHRTWLVFGAPSLAPAESSSAAEPGAAATQSPADPQQTPTSAAPASGSEPESYVPAPAAPQRSAADRLRELNRSLEDGLISPSEYEGERRRILSEY
ncbi:MAG: hypothetical protein K1X75_03125 [Leptospirales bacterium]|nr:hypothetical protein [Leptospirales bacterium]